MSPTASSALAAPIDGLRLAELMLRHGVGDQAETTVTLQQLDEDPFESL